MIETFKIIGIDPGTNTGVSIYTLALPNFEIINIETRLYILKNLVLDPDPTDIYRNHMYERVKLLYDIVQGLIEEERPLAVAYEAAFMNSKFATAVIQLTQYTSTIERAIRDVDSSIKILKYPPKWIKKYVGAGGTAAKDDMLSNLQSIPVINNLLPLNKLSEHEIDATSIAYVLYNDILVQPWILYML